MNAAPDLSRDPRVVELQEVFRAAHRAGDAEAMIDAERRMGRLMIEISRAEIEARSRGEVDELRDSPDRGREDN